MIQHVVKTFQEVSHHQRRHSRARQEAYAKELDDVWVAEGAHQLTFSHELARCFLYAFARHLGGVLEEVVYFLSGTHGSRYGYFLYATI